jgi:hypothetical protein
MIAAFAILSACGANGGSTLTGGGEGSDNTVVVTPAPTPPPTQTPAPTPTPVGNTAIPADIADNFNTALGIEPFDVGGSLQGTLPHDSVDAVGAFRFTCRPGQLLADDPMVYFGKKGASHLHQFSGAKVTDANTTYAVLRTQGGTNCGDDNAPVNRSAYWFPAMLDGAGNVVKPDYFNIYYKQLPASDPNCKARSAGCVGLPNGLKFITGWNATTMTGGPDGYSEYFECWKDDNQSLPAVNGRWKTIADAVKAGCPAGSLLVAQIVSQDCWDGKNIDSADHRSHVAYDDGTGVNVGSGGGVGPRCPAGWYMIPQISVRMIFTTDANFAAGKWQLSSDMMMPGAPAGSTLHFDYMEGWSPTVKATWQRLCIDAHKSCASGELGDGTQIKGVQVPAGGWIRHQLVPLSSIP